MAICLVVSTYWDNYWDNHWDLLATVVIYWLVVSTYPSEKYEFVSWDDEIPNIWKGIKNVPNHQPGIENVLKYLKRRDHESPQIITMIIYHKISLKKNHVQSQCSH